MEIKRGKVSKEFNIDTVIMFNRRKFLKLIGVSATGMCGSSCYKNISNAGFKPNIILIVIDDLGYGDLSCYGNPDVHTKNADRLAVEGIRFTQFYVNSPICSPSRVALTTGQYPQRFKINSFLASRERNRKREMADFLTPKAPTIAKCLKHNGYATAHFGKWHMGGGRDVENAPLPSAYGFDESLVSFEGLGNRILPPGDLSKQSEKLGQGNIRWIEKYEMNLEEKTLIILTSDNGPTDWPKYYKEGFEPPGSSAPFFGRKWSLFEGGIRMPFIARWKGKIPENNINDQTVMAAFDLFPSICKLSGTPFPNNVQFDGEDMSRALLGEQIIRKKDIFWEYGRTPLHLKPGNPKYMSPQLAIRSGDWKLLINEDRSEAKLFNLKEDISEKKNLNARYPELVKMLSEKVLTWRRSMY